MVHPMRRLLVAVALATLGACGDQRPTEPPDPAAARPFLGPSSGPNLVECPTDETKSRTAIIGGAGGTISLDGTSVVFPAGALPGLTTVKLTIPASRYVEIAIETDGAEYFPVKQPVVTINYSRCDRVDVLTKPLTAWYIDAETKDLLEQMVGIDDKLTRSVTFTTSHFSGYAIAF
ncbi:MAG: hypothetical protein M3303_03760 [Gemmatimonadota bacterium]|nr:hypothetical protein [Gemmatimonadota bacterium]